MGTQPDATTGPEPKATIRTEPEATIRTEPKRRALIVWLLLVAITLGYLALDRSVDGQGAYRASSVVTTVAIVAALVKVRFIFREFMQVRNAPVVLLALTDLWVLVIGGTLLGSYFAGMAVH
jgi:Prokaryotic Cytochrome C oxidase subunit IV